MRVALVGSDVADRLACLAEELWRRGLDVTLYTCGPPGRGDVARSFPVVRTRTPVLRDAEKMADAEVAAVIGGFGRFLVEHWTGDRPDVVHADGWSHGLAAQLAASRLSLPTVQALPELSSVVRRRQDRAIGSPARPRFERLLARGATRTVVACTEDVVEIAALGCPRTRVTVLPDGVDLSAFASAAPTGGRGAGHRLVALASNLLPYQGFDDLISALARTRGAEVVIAGGPAPTEVNDDPDVRRLRAVASKHAVAERVHFLGAIEPARVPRLLRSSDVLVCPSWYEPFGTAVVEAMACGLPVIASEAGGMVDAVVHEVTGLLVPPRNPRQLAIALNEMLHAGALRNGMGLAGRARAAACYGWARIAAEAHTLYERTAEAPVAQYGPMAATN